MKRLLSHSLAARLLAAQLLVIVAGSVTLLLVAVSVAPGVFDRHVRDALGIVPPDVGRHLDMAFNEATLVSLGIATGAALLTALGVSWFVSRRLARPIRELALAAQRIARGAYTARVPASGADELALLAGAFNEMAGSLEAAEQKRQELLSDVAHELRTPLATIQGYVEGLGDGVVAPGERAWSALRAETQRLGRLVDDLQKVSRAEERQLDLKLEPTLPAELVEGAVRAAAPAYEASGVALDSRVEPKLPTVAVDRDRLAEVLANLLENALRHTQAGGHVEVGATRFGDDVELAVADDGEGIEPQQLPRVFERFYRTDPARTRERGGSGIGLTIARALVEAHGGSIHAESAGAGRGARFVVRLPGRSLT